MANTYTQLYFHIIFGVKGRANLISENWQEELYKYITGIVTNKDHKLIAIGGMPDHIHLLTGMKPDANLSDLVRDVKANSSRFINQNNQQKWVIGRFEWQQGFGAFTIGHSQLDAVCGYIKTQKEHHRTLSFRDEYVKFLKRYGIDYKSEYVFHDH
ncbi:MAG: IS200/IS605 family transposase [Candidatus Latescibacterota bacterium]